MNKAIVATEIDESLEAGIGKTLHALKPPGVALRHLANADDEMSGKNLGTLLCRVTERSTREVETLIDELQGLRIRAFRSNGGRGRPVLGFAAMLAALLGYFFCMIAVLTAVVGVMIGLSNTSTSERGRHYPHAVVERNVTATPTGTAPLHGCT